MARTATVNVNGIMEMEHGVGIFLLPGMVLVFLKSYSVNKLARQQSSCAAS
jgi:hypothetical protein